MDTARRNMTGDEFRQALEALELGSKGQARFARFTGMAPRTVRAWALGERSPPGIAAYALRVLHRIKKDHPTLFDELTAEPASGLFEKK